MGEERRGTFGINSFNLQTTRLIRKTDCEANTKCSSE